MTNRAEELDDLVDVRRAADLVGRHPETVRRWVWSGRLSARRQGGRLLVARSELQAMAGQDVAAGSLLDWADRVQAARGFTSRAGLGRTAADLVLEDRRQRSGGAGPRARR